MTMQRIEELFHHAIELTGEARGAFLDGACGADPGLRSRVDALLAAASEESLGGPSLESLAGAGEVALDVGPGSRIGRYKLLEEIGEGGFGVVFMAEQTEPVVRRVALKLIKLGMDTKEVVARFEAERQALALMEHPNIARVFDAGATTSGRPYFVMELVRGVPITEFCDANRLAPAARIALMQEVCRAVQHAHQKGVIHRDLKPSNVLVTLHDGAPVPKVIDFGIAKAMHGPLTERTLFTRFQQFIGTPAYMSPEQAEMSGLDIDTRSDIYSLGVLLYELLTGSTPIDAAVLLRSGVAELQRVLREDAVERPSVRVSTRGDAALAARRSSDLSALGKRLRGDLDWIVLKALEKDRQRRYDSAGDLAADLGRYLEDLPVLASPPSARYRARKFVARNRALVTTAGIVLIALMLGIVGTSLGLREAADQRDVAERKAESYAELTDYLIDMLSLADPKVAMRSDVSVRELLELAAARGDDLFAVEPATDARVQSAIGRAYLSLGEHRLADRHLRRSIERLEGSPEPDGFELYRALWAETNVAFKLESPEAFGWARRARLAGHAYLRDETPELAAALDGVHDRVEQAAHGTNRALLEEAAELVPSALAEARAQLPGGDRRWSIVAETFMSSGYWLWYSPSEDIGVRFFEAALEVQGRELEEGDPSRVESLAVVCGILNRLGRTEEAFTRLESAAAELREILAPDNFQRAFVESMLGEGLAAQGRFEEAAAFLEPAHEVLRRGVATPSDFYLQDSYARLLALYDSWPRPEDGARVRAELADALLRAQYLSPWPILERALSELDPEVLAALERLHVGLADVVFLVEPAGHDISIHRDDLRLVLGYLERHADSSSVHAAIVARALHGLSRALSAEEDRALALALCDACYAVLEAWPVESAIELASNRGRAAELLALTSSAGMGSVGRAELVMERAAESRRWLERARDGSSTSWFGAVHEVQIARGLSAAKQYAAAGEILLGVRDVFVRQLGEPHAQTATVRCGDRVG